MAALGQVESPRRAEVLPRDVGIIHINEEGTAKNFREG